MSTFEYKYSAEYGKRTVSVERNWYGRTTTPIKAAMAEEKRDTRVDKALDQNEKEARLPFPKLLAKLQHEAEVHARAMRRDWDTPYELITFTGPLSKWSYGYKRATETEKERYGKDALAADPTALSRYWIEGLQTTCVDGKIRVF